MRLLPGLQEEGSDRSLPPRNRIPSRTREQSFGLNGLAKADRIPGLSRGLVRRLMRGDLGFARPSGVPPGMRGAIIDYHTTQSGKLAAAPWAGDASSSSESRMSATSGPYTAGRFRVPARNIQYGSCQNRPSACPNDPAARHCGWLVVPRQARDRPIAGHDGMECAPAAGQIGYIAAIAPGSSARSSPSITPARSTTPCPVATTCRGT